MKAVLARICIQRLERIFSSSVDLWLLYIQTSLHKERSLGPKYESKEEKAPIQQVESTGKAISVFELVLESICWSFGLRLR